MKRHGTHGLRQRLAAVPPAALTAWLLLLLLLLVLEPPVLRLLGLLVFELLAPLALVSGAVWWMVRLGAGRARLGPPDPLADEEAGRRRRLAELRARSEQMQATLRELRALRLDEAETTRARWAESDLEAGLLSVRAQMAVERAGLARVEAVRWLERAEPLLRELELLEDEASLQLCLGRLGELRCWGAAALARLRADPEAGGTPAGAEAERLLVTAVEELARLRVELITRRAELLARSAEAPAVELPEPDHPAALRLRELLARSRARRELRGDPAGEEPGAGTP